MIQGFLGVLRGDVHGHMIKRDHHSTKCKVGWWAMIKKRFQVKENEIFCTVFRLEFVISEMIYVL